MKLMPLRPMQDVGADLRSDDPAVREDAVRETLARKDAAFLPRLLEHLLTESDGGVLGLAAEAVKQITGLPVDIKPQDPPATRRVELVRWRAWHAIQPDLKTLADGNPKQRQEAAKRIIGVPDSRAVEAVAKQLIKETDPNAAQAMQKALEGATAGQFQPMGRLPKEPVARAERVNRWLVWRRAKSEVEVALAERDAAKRASAIRPLAQYKHAKVVDALLDQLLRERDDGAVKAVTYAIAEIAGRRLIITPGATSADVRAQVADFKTWWANTRRRYE